MFMIYPSDKDKMADIFNEFDLFGAHSLFKKFRNCFHFFVIHLVPERVHSK